MRLEAGWATTVLLWAVALSFVVIAWSQVRQATALERISAQCVATTPRSEPNSAYDD